AKIPGPQSIRLASTSMGNTLVVDHFSLSPLNPKKWNGRYILLSPSSALYNEALLYGQSLLSVACILLAGLMLFQSGLDYFLGGPENSISIFPDSIRQYIALAPKNASNERLIMSEGAEGVKKAVIEPLIETHHKLKDLLHQLPHLHTSHDSSAPSTHPPPEAKAVIVRAGADSADLSTEVHHTSPEEVLKKETQARRWAELTEEERAKWRHRLVEAGEWTVQEGETILKGILFSEYAGIVGEAVRGAVAG
ncbi:hypothetical protein LTS18_002402, partial [Coniosporium uncinatum]